jgi:hypothetical protein
MLPFDAASKAAQGVLYLLPGPTDKVAAEATPNKQDNNTGVSRLILQKNVGVMPKVYQFS